ncbi:MAG: hypothetical protein H6706_27580 [Myxococcales bacterium]|nr:hypothetical protein [Myxococcales bacterium]MCB9549583.1 hypothetical protein [Myxococcales bacterium]
MAEKLRIELPRHAVLTARLGALMMIYETTSKVIDDRFAFVPTEQCSAILVGVLAQAQRMFPLIDVYAFHFLSNHLHLLIGAPTLRDKSAFLEWTLREISRRINKLLDRTGSLLEQNHCIQVTTLAHALERLRYLMGQATAQHLVRHPAEDIFPSSTPALLFGKAVEGVFQYANQAPMTLKVRVDRLPGLEELSVKDHRALMWTLADDLAAEARPKRKKAGIRLPDPESLRRLDPMTRPKTRDRSPAPVVHGPPEHHDEWHEVHGELRAAYTVSTRAYHAWQADPTQVMIPWPAHTLPPAFSRPRRARAGAA